MKECQIAFFDAVALYQEHGGGGKHSRQIRARPQQLQRANDASRIVKRPVALPLLEANHHVVQPSNELVGLFHRQGSTESCE